MGVPHTAATQKITSERFGINHADYPRSFF